MKLKIFAMLTSRIPVALKVPVLLEKLLMAIGVFQFNGFTQPVYRFLHHRSATSPRR